MRPTSHRLITGDARNLAPFEDASVHLIVTSPPYPMIAMWDDSFARLSTAAARALDRDDGEAAWTAMHELLDATWHECARLLVDGGLLCVNVGDAVRTVDGEFRLFSNHSRIVTALASLGLTLLPMVIWRKPTNAPTKFMGSGMLPGGAYVTLEHEYVIIARKGPPRRPRTADDHQRRRRSAIFWEERNTWYSDVWSFAGTRQALAPGSGRARSAAFPFALAYRLVSMFSWQEDTVLDPFAGTGTTTLAAMAAGRDSAGVEINPEIAAAAMERLTAPSTADRLAAVTSERLADHRRFVDTRTKPCAHRNEVYHVPVVTRQERDLVIPWAVAVERLDDRTLRARYSTTPEPGLELFEPQ